MGGQDAAPSGPDLSAGIAIAGVPEGKLVAGHVGGEAVLLARQGSEWFATGAVCSHYSGPLPEGLKLSPWLAPGSLARGPAACLLVPCIMGITILLRCINDTRARGAIWLYSNTPSH